VYSPRIREELVPFIYRAAKELKIPMTVWVNAALTKALQLQESPETENAFRHSREEQPTEQEEETP
jgi:hypothetical protein